MKFADVHAHLDLEQFDADRDLVVSCAKEAGCVAVINNATDLASMKKILDISEKYPLCKCAFGLYPDVVVKLSNAELDECLKYISASKSIVAIGEIGLDYKYTLDEVSRQKQRVYFEKQLLLAKKMKKPVIVHSRNAEDDVIEAILKCGNEKVVLHCFCGSDDLIRSAIDAGFSFSIPVRVVSSKRFSRLVELAPCSRLLTETDSPYMNNKQERNEPANVVRTIEAIAKIKKLDAEETANILLSNYLKMFS